jgi:hypothetical protein
MRKGIPEYCAIVLEPVMEVWRVLRFPIRYHLQYGLKPAVLCFVAVPSARRETPQSRPEFDLLH